MSTHVLGDVIRQTLVLGQCGPKAAKTVRPIVIRVQVRELGADSLLEVSEQLFVRQRHTCGSVSVDLLEERLLALLPKLTASTFESEAHELTVVDMQADDVDWVLVTFVSSCWSPVLAVLSLASPEGITFAELKSPPCRM